MTDAPQIGDIVFVLDGDNLVHRVYHSHAVDGYTAPDGTPLNAVIGWVRSIRRLRGFMGRIQSRWIVPCFDSRPSWRTGVWPQYKADRSERDPALEAQWPLIDEACAALGLQPQRHPGLEADDLVASWTEALVERGCSVVIVSNDKDLLQLVRPGVRQMRRENGEIVLLGPDQVRARFGVAPDRLGDLLALTGDASDGIPGLAGVGRKTAAKILAERGSLEQALANWMLVSPPLGERLRDHAVDLRMYRDLVSLRVVEVDAGALTPAQPSSRALTEFFGRFGYPRWESAVDPARDA